jgi:phospholipase C
VVNLLQNQPALFGTYKQFLEDCDKNQLPQYCFIEPNYSDHEDAGGEVVACDQHPDHDVQQGEAFLAEVYNKIRTNSDLWKSTAMLVLYDEHGGIYDHVKPPACTPDGFSANPEATGVPGVTFNFDRLGVRVPAILISPWIPEGTVVPGPSEGGRAFEHASIPNTVTQHFLGNYADATPREKTAPTFLDLLSDTMRSEEDCPVFEQA